MTASPSFADEMREFEFVVEFEHGVDDLMDVFQQYDSLSVWSSAVFTTEQTMWRLDHAKGTSEALDAFDAVFLDETRCNECLDVPSCDTARSYHVLDRRATARTIYTLRHEVSRCHSIPYFVLDHVREGVLFESRRTGTEYRWRVLYPGTQPIGELFDTIETHLRDGVSLSISHLTSAGNWQATASINADLSPAHWTTLEAAVAHGYYERPRAVSVSDLATILDEPRSTVQYRLRTAEDCIVSQFVESAL
ncbi:helix-turn-helix domain-containing protein [Halorientalis brevis]|uniref:Helix-turn-helix domain-containing protein n=1 Tax=Halorientalis brevis TaxID=1126241 RepID=A0ABD6CBM9_9EURY|nr:helix-turn-helix domain-containing protein [Halorientalis brevis]